MLARSFNKLENQDFGFQLPGRVVVEFHNPPGNYTVPQFASLYRELEEQPRSSSRRQGSGLAMYNPLTNNWGETGPGRRPSCHPKRAKNLVRPGTA